MPLDPNIAGLLQMTNSTPALSAGTPADARAALRMLMVTFRDPAGVVQVASVEAGFAGGVPVRVYRPAESASGTATGTIVYLHGGGFVIGDLDTHDGACRRLCRDANAVVVSVDYRLAPEHPFPAAVDDCYAALTWVAANIGDYGADDARLVVGGDSAGGNLAAVCAQQAQHDGLSLAGQLLLYPSTDMSRDYPSRTENGDGYFLTLADVEWFAAQYTGITGGAAALADPAVSDVAADPRLSPLRAASLTGLPPAVVATAEFDPLRDEGDAYADALSAVGVRVAHRQFPGLIHGFYGLEQFSPAIAEATSWINAQVAELLR
ncbi:alpha/beta hydrolase [uncultured Jatrophihabitans sp.]|uniref:alpha/beta hydrolase n=1 Tax=uncultured Jatrophihabitans sp. TaxID=1610747 RepID=UPI0035CAE6CA